MGVYSIENDPRLSDRILGFFERCRSRDLCLEVIQLVAAVGNVDNNKE